MEVDVLIVAMRLVACTGAFNKVSDIKTGIRVTWVRGKRRPGTLAEIEVKFWIRDRWECKTSFEDGGVEVSVKGLPVKISQDSGDERGRCVRGETCQRGGKGWMGVPPEGWC
jgi:hypothetical protein